MNKANEIQTIKLHSGLTVLAKEWQGELWAVTYANRTQAYRKQVELGPEWVVVQRGRPFFVALESEVTR